MLLVAVSGGVDSCVLLDFLLRQNRTDLAVAHFNHGTRPSADADAEFVRDLAHAAGLPFYSQKVALGPTASEATARNARYRFLKTLAAGDPIYTAHHLDDLCESLAINLRRGTGWRGLTPFFDPQIRQPFLDPNHPWDQNDILRYAADHHLTWRQDPTNNDPQYLRNRLRPALKQLTPATRQQLFTLYQTQLAHRRGIESLDRDLLAPLAVSTPAGTLYPRDFFRTLDATTAAELLRSALAETGLTATRPQRSDLAHAIQTYAPGKKFNLPQDRFVTFTKTHFCLPARQPVL